MNNLRLGSKIFLTLILFSGYCAGQAINCRFADLNGQYMGQPVPADRPVIFAPGTICTGMNERDIAITADGNELYFGLSFGRTVTLLCSRYTGGKWCEPEVPSFAADKNYFYFEPCLSADANRIFFLSNMPPEGKEPKPGWTYQNIWAADRNSDGSWSKPYNPDTNINNGGQQYFPSLTRNGTLYFTRVDNQLKKPQILRSKYLNGRYQPAEKLPEKINGFGEPFNAFIAPDESFLIVCVDKIQNQINPGKSNYYVFFRDSADNWSEACLMPPEINIKGSNAASAFVTPDMKYLFFAAQINSAAVPKTLSDYRDLYEKPLNGGYDIFWVDAGIITKLKNGNNNRIKNDGK